MTSVNTNGAAMTALRILRGAQDTLAAISRRVSTGFKVSTPNEDASTFAVAQGIRGDLKAWQAVQTSQANASGAVKVAVAAAEMVSDRLGDLRKKLIEYGAAQTAPQRSIIEGHVLAMLGQIDTLVDNAFFNEVNLVSRGVPPPPPPLPPQPAGFGIASAAGGAGVTTNTHAAPGTAGTIFVDVDAFGVPDEFEVLYDGVVVATTGGPISGKARLSFAYPAAPVLDFQVRVTGPTGTAWTYTPYFDNAPALAVPPPAGEPALTVLKNIDGDMFTIERRNLTTQALGLSALTLDPLSAGLAALDGAQTIVAEALGYFGATDRSLRGLTGIANAVTDGTGEGLGSMVDADLAAESARLIAAQIRVELSTKGLSIANAAPDHLRQLFSTRG